MEQCPSGLPVVGPSIAGAYDQFCTCSAIQALSTSFASAQATGQSVDAANEERLAHSIFRDCAKAYTVRQLGTFTEYRGPIALRNTSI